MTTDTNNKFNEAGGIAFTKLYSQKGLEVNITARANTPIEAIDSLVEAIKYAMDKYNFDVGYTGQQSSQPIQDNMPAEEEQPGMITIGDDKIIYDGMISTEWMDVIPQPDGETTVLEFWNKNRNYPEFKTKSKNYFLEQAAPWLDLSQPNRCYGVTMYYVNSKNVSPKSGKPYKNIVLITQDE